jgi:glycosyltransferase involved in cell wall biosynthesis
MLTENLVNRDSFLFLKWITPEKKVFEWGIDERSIFFNEIAGSFLSVYYDERQIEIIKSSLSRLRTKKVPPVSSRKNIYDPAAKGEFTSYINSIEGKYDVILVRGRDRVSCAKKALDHLEDNGVLVIQDFWNRQRYSEVLDYYDVVDGHNLFSSSPVNNVVVLSPKKKDRKKLLIYSGYSNKKFNAESLRTHALGGSETATIRTAKEFKKLGYDVVVMGNVIDSVSIDGVRYISREYGQEYLDRNKMDVIIISRYLHFLTHFRFSTEQLYLLNHDVCYLPWGIDKNVENNWNLQAKLGNVLFERSIERFDNIICLTNWHRDHYTKLYPFTRDKIYVWGNGIEFEMFPPHRPKIKNKFIWVSRAARGLRRMLDMWPEIKERYPDATLDIYSYSGAGEEDVVERCQSLEGVIHHGGVPQSVLLDRMQDAEYWFYPTNFEETYCITALEMQHSKVCCVCTNLAALRDTAGERAITFEIPTQGYQSEEFKRIALDSLFRVMEDTELKESLIEKAYQWSLTQIWMHRSIE